MNPLNPLFLVGLAVVAIIVLAAVLRAIEAVSKRSASEENQSSTTRRAPSASDLAATPFAAPPPLTNAASASSPQTAPDSDVIRDLLRQQRKIEAIKLYRDQTGVGLKAAKDAVEEIEQSFKELPPVLSSASTEDIYDLVRQGQKIQAIKLYRDQTGVGLKAAKDAVEAMERGESRPILEAQTPAFTSTPITGIVPTEEIRALLRQGQKIPAIKLYKDCTGSGLKDAKDAVEAIEQAGL